MGQEILNTQRKHLIQQYLNTNEDLELLGNGAFGTAFLYKGRVYKLTTDLDDYLTAKQLIKRGRKFKHFVKIYSAKIIEVQLKNWADDYYTANLYLIVSEYVKPFNRVYLHDDLTKELWREFTRYNNCYYILGGEVSPNKNIPEVEKYNPTLVKQFYEQMCSVYSELKRLKYKSWDNHGENWGFDSNGTIKIFDCGCANKGVKPRYNKKRKITLTANI